MKQFIFTIFLYVLFAILSAQPLWYQKPLSVYSQTQYIIGVGEGDSFEEATEIAKADLSQQITMTALADDDIFDNDSESGASAYYAEYINANIYKTVSALMAKLEVKNREQIDGKHYVLVALQRQQLLSSISNNMGTLWSRIQTNLKKAEKDLEEYHFVATLDLYSRTQMLLSELLLKKFFYDNIAVKPYYVDEQFSETYIENYVNNLVAIINFEVLSGNLQTTRKGTILPKPIIFRATAKINGKNLALGNLPISIYYGDGVMIESGVTSSDGRYQIYALGIPHSGDTGKIHIQIDPSRFPHFYNQNLKQKAAVAHFKTTMAAPLYVSLSVTSADAKLVKGAYNQIDYILSSQNIRQSDRAAVYIKGLVSSRQKIQLSEALQVTNQATVNISLEFGLINTNEVLGTLTATGIGTSDRNENEAINLALLNTTINPRELSDMINRASQATASTDESRSAENLARGKRLYVDGKYKEALDTLLSVDVDTAHINEAINLVNIIKRQVRW